MQCFAMLPANFVVKECVLFFDCGLICGAGFRFWSSLTVSILFWDFYSSIMDFNLKFLNRTLPSK